MTLRENGTSWWESPLNTRNYENLRFNDVFSRATKSVLEDMLHSGIIIQDERSYNALRWLMRKYFQVPLCSFKDITEWFGWPSWDIDASGKRIWFRLAWKSWGDIVVYPDDTGLFSGQSWYIRNGRFVSWSIPPTSLNYTKNDTLFDIPKGKDIPATKQEIPIVSKYIVQKWDTLWKIVKKQYGLTDTNDIANMVNALVKDNKDPGQYGVELHQKKPFDADHLREWNILILPANKAIKRKIPRQQWIQRVDTIEK